MKAVQFSFRQCFLCLFGLLFFVSSSAIFAMVDATQEKANQTLHELYSDKIWHNLRGHKSRLGYISEKFLDYPYFLNALGDGIDSAYDQFPLYRFDVFDCETYVTTMLSLALAKNPEDFKQTMLRIRYINEKNKLSYFERNHFPEVDWNVNNAKKGFVKDITAQILNKHGQAIHLIASTSIDRPAWVQKMNEKTLRLRDASPETLPQRVQELKDEGKNFEPEMSNLPYLPISAIDDAVLAQIPDASIIEIVRPDWNIKSWMGTNVNVSHMGLAFWKGGTLMFREASFLYL